MDNSFFLWGPRQTGKSTLLKTVYPDAIYIDLLKSDEFRRYLDRPELLREELKLADQQKMVIIDEVQKVPLLLDEVHWLIENTHLCFALCGSSARKLKRGQANLLGGRAHRFLLYGLVSTELGDQFDLVRVLNHGYLPRYYLSNQYWKGLESYVGDYLREEVAAEGLVRNLSAFSSFLNAASFSDSEIVNFSTIARDCGVSSHTIKEYFQILVDTYLGSWLPAYTRRPKRKIIESPKFYFSDVGVVNFLAKRRSIEPGSELFGKAFENWVYHELNAYNSYQDRNFDLSYWRLTTGVEVDFIIGRMEIAIEVKASQKIGKDQLKGLRELKLDHPNVQRRIIVCLETKVRETEDGILILPALKFTKMLWTNELLEKLT